MKSHPSSARSIRLAVIAGIAILVCGAAYWAYATYELSQHIRRDSAEAASSTAAYMQALGSLKQRLGDSIAENKRISAMLSDEQKKSLDLQAAKVRNEQKIDILTKLTTIDPELIKKYSKVYFLSENYVPARLAYVATSSLVSSQSKPVPVLADIMPFLSSMLADATRDGIPLRVLSGYRSFQTQMALKTGYKVIYGAGTANQFSADQGYSEHQLGTALDFTTPDTVGADQSFEDTTAFRWLNLNAYKYGFVISYPKNNSYYEYEPWHWRFVGRDLANLLRHNNQYFYEMDQRDIDQHLINLFD